MTTFEGLRALGLIAVLTSSVVWSEDPPVSAPRTHLARADTGKKAPVPLGASLRPKPESRAQPTQTATGGGALVQPSGRGLTAAYSLMPQEQSVAAQEYLARRAARMPGFSCDPDGPVYQVLGDTQASAEPPSGRTDLLIRIGVGGRPDEVRIERSGGDPELDAAVALKVCEALAVRDAVPGQLVQGGWVRLSVRLLALD